MKKRQLSQAMIDKQFKPGQSGNPSGKPPMSQEERKLRRLSKEQFAEVAGLIVQGKEEQLAEILKDESAPMLKKYVAKALQDGFKRSDWSLLNSLLDRLIGKPKEMVTISTPRKVVEKLDGTKVIYENKNEDEL